MDIRCKHCGEPIDTFEFHDHETGAYQDWVNCFKINGCGAVDAMFDGERPQDATKCKDAASVGDFELEAIEILQDMLGDDIDGLTSMTEDFFG